MIRFLERLTALSQLPAWFTTFSAVAVWWVAILGGDAAAAFWDKSGGSITAFTTLTLGTWLGYKGVTKVAETRAEVAKAEAATAKSETETAKIEAKQEETP